VAKCQHEYEVVATVRKTSWQLNLLFFAFGMGHETHIVQHADNYLAASSLAREVREKIGSAIEGEPKYQLKVDIRRIA